MKTAVVLGAGPVPDLDHAAESAPIGEPTSQCGTLRERLLARISAVAPSQFIAADGGLDLSNALGLSVSSVIGDMDSVSRSGLSQAESSGVSVTTLPREKDQSDYELALDLAVSSGAERILMVGSDRGRLDHVLATVTTLTAPKYADLILEAWLVDTYVAVINGGRRDSCDPGDRGHDTALIRGRVGEKVSLFAFNGPVSGLTSSGLRWPLDEDDLSPGTSLGVSNELNGELASVHLESGCLVIVKPEGSNR